MRGIRRLPRAAGGRRARRSRDPAWQGVRFLLHHLFGGVIGAVAFMGLIMAFDLAGLRGLILGSPHGWVAGGLLLFGLVVTFGSVAMGAAVMLLGRERS